MIVFIFFIVGIVLGGLTVVLALQNIDVVAVSFFAWQFEGSLSLLLLLATLMGIIIAFFIILPESIGNYFRYRKLRKENVRLEEELRKQKELTHFARTEPATPAEITAIENGATQEHVQ